MFGCRILEGRGEEGFQFRKISNIYQNIDQVLQNPQSKHTLR